MLVEQQEEDAAKERIKKLHEEQEAEKKRKELEETAKHAKEEEERKNRIKELKKQDKLNSKPKRPEPKSALEEEKTAFIAPVTPLIEPKQPKEQKKKEKKEKEVVTQVYRAKVKAPELVSSVPVEQPVVQSQLELPKPSPFAAPVQPVIIKQTLVEDLTHKSHSKELEEQKRAKTPPSSPKHIKEIVP